MHGNSIMPFLAIFHLPFTDSLYSYTSFPEQHHRKIHTNNVTERFNRELKRRAGKTGAFPNNDSLMRLVVSIAININEPGNDSCTYFIIPLWPSDITNFTPDNPLSCNL